MAAFSPSAHWRDSARASRFFMIDSSAAFPFLLFLLHITLWSFIVAVSAMLVLTLLRRYGFTIPIFLRLFRSVLAGPRKYAIPWWKE